MNGVLEVKRAGASVHSSPAGSKTARKARRSIVPPEAKPKRLTEEQSYLAAEYWDWAMGVARKQAEKYKLYDSFAHLDWEGAAAIGICDAAYTFEPERGIKFTTYAYRRVRFAITDMLRAEHVKGYGRHWRFEGAPVIQSLATVVASDGDGRTVTLGMWIEADPDLTDATLEPDENFEQAIRCLSETQREIFRGYYRRDLTMKQIGKRLGLSESRVSQLHSQSIELLRASSLPREALAS